MYKQLQIKRKHVIRGLQSQFQRSRIFPACGAPAHKILFQNSRITHIWDSHYKTRGEWRYLLYLLVTGLLSQGLHEPRLTLEHMTIQIQRRDVTACDTQITTVFRAMHSHRMQHSLIEWLDGWPCMETEGATDATGMGDIDTPPKEL